MRAAWHMAKCSACSDPGAGVVAAGAQIKRCPVRTATKASRSSSIRCVLMLLFSSRSESAVSLGSKTTRISCLFGSRTGSVLRHGVTRRSVPVQFRLDEPSAGGAATVACVFGVSFASSSFGSSLSSSGVNMALVVGLVVGCVIVSLIAVVLVI